MVSKQEQVIDLSKPIVVDGTNLIAGRVASNVAKLLRKGNRVSIVNCDKIMISGRKAKIRHDSSRYTTMAEISRYIGGTNF